MREGALNRRCIDRRIENTVRIDEQTAAHRHDVGCKDERGIDARGAPLRENLVLMPVSVQTVGAYVSVDFSEKLRNLRRTAGTRNAALRVDDDMPGREFRQRQRRE